MNADGKKNKHFLEAVRGKYPMAVGALTSIGVSSGGKTVTLTSETRDRINKQLADGTIQAVKLTGNTQEMVDQIRKAVGGSKEQPMAKNGPRPTEVCEVCNERITRNTQAEVDADMELHMKAHPSLVSNPLPSLPAPVHAARERQRKADKAVFELKKQSKVVKAEKKKADMALGKACDEAGQGILFDEATGEVAG
jgi:hypothetical protein